MSLAVSTWALQANVSPAFTPVRSELTHARGFSRGLLNLVVLPSGDTVVHAPAWWLVAGVLGFLLLLVPAGARQQQPSTAGAVIEAGALVLLAVAVLSPLVSPYRVVFAPRTFVLLWLLLSATRVRSLASSLRARWPRDGKATARYGVVAAGVLGAGFFASVMLQQLSSYHGNYSGFLHLSRAFATSAPFLQERPEVAGSLLTSDAGYDGQFMYLIAFDPFLQRFKDDVSVYAHVVDDPPYRYGRIGFSALTRVVSGASAGRFPAAMVWLTVLAHLPLAMALALIASQAGRSPFVGLAYLAIPSFAVSTAFALPEGLAAAGLVGGVALWQRNRLGLAALCFAASLLIRETGVLLIVPLIVATALKSRRSDQRSWGPAAGPALWLVGALVPVALWRAFVASRFFGEFGSHALMTSPGDFGLPFLGLARLANAGLTHTQAAPESLGAVVFPFVLIAALLVAVGALLGNRGPLEVAAVGYGAIAVSLNYDKIWSHLPSGERGAFELFVSLLVIYLMRRQWPSWLDHSFAGLFGVLCVYTLFVSPEASASRAALLLIR